MMIRWPLGITRLEKNLKKKLNSYHEKSGSGPAAATAAEARHIGSRHVSCDRASDDGPPAPISDSQLLLLAPSRADVTTRAFKFAYANVRWSRPSRAAPSSGAELELSRR